MKLFSATHDEKQRRWAVLFAVILSCTNLLSAFCNWVSAYLIMFEKKESGFYGQREAFNSYEKALGFNIGEWALWADRAKLLHFCVLALCLILLGILALVQVWPFVSFVKGVLGLYLVPVCVAYVFAAAFDPMGMTQATEALIWIPNRGLRWGMTLAFGLAVFVRGYLHKQRALSQQAPEISTAEL